jgi:hypothetical protein
MNERHLKIWIELVEAEPEPEPNDEDVMTGEPPMPPDPDEYIIIDPRPGLDHKAGPWNGQPLDHFAYYLAGILAQHLLPKWATMPETLIKDAVSKAINESTQPGGHNMPRGD